MISSISVVLGGMIPGLGMGIVGFRVEGEGELGSEGRGGLDLGGFFFPNGRCGFEDDLGWIK